jgi:hypothetical protein
MVPVYRGRSRHGLIDWSELARADCVVPETLADVEQLAKSILNRRRDFWIVVLTARRLEAMPSVSAVVVREIVGASLPVIFLRSSLATYLSTLLPSRTQVYGGALRVYRPGVSDDPWGHPLLYDPSGEYGEEILDWLGRIFTPSVARPPRLSPEERVLVLEHELKLASRARHVVRGRYEAWVLGEQARESGRHRPRRLRRPGGKLRDELRRLIAAQWDQLPRRERSEHPLRDYTMSTGFLKDVRGRVGRVPIDRLAWVCALVVCGFDVSRVGLAAGPLRQFPEAPELVREDGAKAWWCDLRRSSPTHNPRLLYWSCPDGRAELVALGYPTDGS